MTEAEENLLHRYLDGGLSPQEFEALEELLRGDVEARRTLRTFATIDSKWQQLAADGDLAGVRRSRGRSRADAARRAWPIASGLAALLVLGFFVVAALNSREPEQAERGVATVIHLEGEGRVNQAGVLAIGDELFAGDKLTMEAGLIELAYRESGVHALATAPLVMGMDSTMRVNLVEGEMKLVVPPQGIGFVVDTPERRITDLGTSFVVKASETGSRVLVLDGRVAVHGGSGDEGQLMAEGDLAKFGRDGKVHLRTERHPDIAELLLGSLAPTTASLRGQILGFEGEPAFPRQRPNRDVIARQILPLVQSGFQDRACLNVMKEGAPLRFSGIAGSYRTFPERAGLSPYPEELGWLSWYGGQVRPPKPGRYRFWGYADNHLLVSIDGKPVFEGSRRDSPFKELGIPRTDHPSYPCLNATAGFACGSWFEVGNDGARLDLVFGEIMNRGTSGVLLIEREGETYEETYWGQPKWPLFLTEPPNEDEVAELETLHQQMETKLVGSFSISNEATWMVIDE